ncbi:MAG: serpin family protein [Bacteroidales bacterium]|nr:serpin family protein [Bacteroidales bacterium]
MKTANILSVLAGLSILLSCSDMNEIKVRNPITVTSPAPTEQITKVSLDETQTSYVEAGNRMAFRFLEKMYDGKNLICSPLSLQYALAMTANGASGETLQEIIDFLGYGEEGISALNEYSKVLLEQLPAVDLKVSLKVTDALIVNDEFPLLPSFKKTVEDYYYAAVENMDFSDPEQIAARINDWTDRNTNGFIDKVIEPSEISADAVAYIMNALYFKAKWAGDKYDPMFVEEGTRPEDFHLSNGKTVKADMMRNTTHYEYAEMDGFRAVVLPYSNGKFNMYVLLPDENDIEGLIEKLQSTAWNEILSNLKRDAEVNVWLPKFSIENKYNLNEALSASGVNKAFEAGQAEFDMMFEPKSDYRYWISKVIQKSRIAVSEWGTEAGSVTIVQMDGAMSPEPEPKRVEFHIDHPFVFVIGEETSGTILFEGVVMQP